MKVSNVGPTVGAGPTRKTVKTEKSGGGAFADRLAETYDSGDAEEAPGVDAPAAVGGMDALLAIQNVGDSLDKEQRRRWVRYGEDILDQLEGLRHGLLLGTVPKEKLIALAQMVRGRREQVTDPRLASVLDEIELRAEVELAKLSSRGL